MAALLKKLLIGTSVAVGMSVAGMAPAFAGGLTNAKITGSDYILYDVSGSQTVKTTDDTKLQSILGGNELSPTGNVELFASSEKSPLSPGASATPAQRFTALNNFLGFTGSTVLSGQIGGKDISLSSMTAADWFGGSLVASTRNALALATNNTARSSAINGLYNTSNFATQWFGETLSKYGMASNQTLFNTFLLAGGFQRFSDPNISYVNQDDKTGKISIGLAGHYDAATLLGLPSNPNKPIQASEVVKYSYNGGGSTGFLYSHSAKNSKLTAADDGRSHSGNYEVSLAGVAPAAVPEPSTMLGLMAVGGLFGLAKRNSSKKA